MDREDVRGVANQRAATRGLAKGLRDQLSRHFEQSNEPMWVAVQNRGEHDPDQYWVGRALRMQAPFTQSGYVEGVDRRERYDVGDCLSRGRVVGSTPQRRRRASGFFQMGGSCGA